MSVTSTPQQFTGYYHRDAHGLEIEYLQEFDPAKSYLHYVEETTDESGTLVITTLCGERRAPSATDFLGPRNDGQLVCPHCYNQTILRRPLL